MIVVVGAGLAGLIAAGELAADGTGVVLVERNRSAGGRLATRQIGRAQLDIGAQFFTVRSADFQARVDDWLAAGWVEEWCRGFGDPADGHPRYRATGGMRNLARHLATSLPDSVEVATKVAASAVVPLGDCYSVTYDGGRRLPDEADAVVLALPIPEALAVLDAGPIPLDDEVRSQLEAVTYHRVIAVMVVLDRSPGLEPPGAIQSPDDETFTFVADNQAKGISEVPALTLHLSHALSAELWDADDGAVLVAVHDQLRQLLNGASVTEVQLQRWRHAAPTKPFAHPCDVIGEHPPLILAGDAYAETKVEGAFRSGLAAALASRSLLDSDDLSERESE